MTRGLQPGNRRPVPTDKTTVVLWRRFVYLAHVNHSTLCDRTATEQAALLRAGEVSAREVLEAHLERIEAVNPRINAVVTLAADRARAEASRADEQTAAGTTLPPLHGLPVAVKDTADTEGIRTTYGSPLFADNVPAADALHVARIRRAGGIVIGKTNVPEFAAGSHTFNTLFGVTRNPYDTGRSAGGSSGGSAAALRTGMVPLAEGSDLGGSLRNPASFCNVVGFRPSPGRVPTWQHAASWSPLPVAGPMGRTVADAALLLSVMAGPDPRSPISLQDDPAVFAGPLDRDLAGMRLAFSADLGGAVPVDREVRAALAGVPAAFRALGAEVDEGACPGFGGAAETFQTLRAWMFHGQFGDAVMRMPERFKETIRWNVARGARLTGGDVARAEAMHGVLYDRVRAFFERYDALLLPVSQVAPFPVGTEYPTVVDGVPQHTYIDWMQSSSIITLTGSPAISVPAAFTASGLPVGLQIVGPHRADLDVLRIAHVFEQATRAGDRTPAPLNPAAEKA